MSTNAKTVQQAKPAVKVAKTTPQPAQPKPKMEMTLLFDKENYLLMIGGVALIFIGFLLMTGGKSANPHEFHTAEIYSFRRITLAPIIILAGFGLEVFAIMKKPKETNKEN